MLSVVHTLSLTAISMAYGLVMLWAFARFSNQEKIRLAKRKLRACLYAFRLYGDEPVLVLRAQKELLIWNARYLTLMLAPSVVLLIPTVFLLLQLDAIYGLRLLAPGESTIVTAQLAGSEGVPTPSLRGSGVVVETPAVRAIADHQVAWRIRAGTAPGQVMLDLGSTHLTKNVSSGAGFRYLSERRVASWFDWIRFPAEGLLPGDDIRWIEVRYPPGEIDFLGWGMHWLIWFSVICLATALLLRNRLRVTF